MEFIELCKRLISVDSTPSVGNEDAAIFCATLCKDLGFQVTLQEAILNEKKQYNVVARPGKAPAGEEVIFQTHLDTVEPGPLANWTKTDNNPFKATIDGDCIYGLGTADVKLDFLCKVRALKEFVGKSLKKPFALVGTFGEEIGMHGAQHLIASGNVKAKMAIIGEPSELRLVYANNGYMVLDFSLPFSEEELQYRERTEPESATTQEKIFHGKAAHSSTPHLGDNAILKLIQYLEKMPNGIAILSMAGGSSVNTVPAAAHVEVDADHFFSKSVGDRLLKLTTELKKLETEFLNYETKEFSPPHPTLNLGVLKTETWGLELSVSFRVTPNVEMDQLEKWIARLNAVCGAENITCKRSRLSPPALTPLNSDLVTGAVTILKEMKLPETPITKASGTECSVYRPHGIDCVVIGPGVSVGNSHTANEYNILSQLDMASRFYGEAVKRFCL